MATHDHCQDPSSSDGFFVKPAAFTGRSAPVIQRLRAKLAYLRLRPFDVSTEDGRSAERYRLASWSALANFGSRGMAMVAMILSVSLTIGYLGQDRFGAWAVLSSLVNMLSFMDLGIGNALVNRVAHAFADGRLASIQRVVGGGLGVLAGVAMLAWVLLATVFALVPWGDMLKLSDPALIAEITTAAQVLAALFAINLLSSGCLKVLVGQQRAFEAHCISFCGALAACGFVAWAAHERAGIPVLLMATFGAQAVAGLAAVWVMRARRQLLGRGLIGAARSERSPLMRTGGVFLALQIGTMIGWGSDSVMLASVRGAADVASLAIAQRLFMFASQPIAVFIGPLWAAYADAHARNDRAFLARTLRRSMVISVALAAMICATLLALSPWVIPAWTGNVVHPPWSLLFAFAVWTIIEAGGNAFGTYLNGAGLVREQLLVVLIFCAVALPVKYLAASQAGATGLLVATTLSYLMTVVLLYATLLRSRVLAPLQPSTT